ncbi:MAG: ISL3 family transposase [Bacteroidaceae bacterium]|nr:ISL3 family transposase [Bacteroidaceae bacterium]
MNDITNILGLEDSSIDILSVTVEGSTREFTIEKKLVPVYCPACGCRMYSKGIRVRTVNHPIFQDGYRTVLKVRQRRWRCTGCDYSTADDFRFLSKYKHSTNATDFMILDALKDLNNSVVDVARMFNVSDAHVHRVFGRYVDMQRLPLSEAICIDEVHTDSVSYSKYSMVIYDFVSGQPIDILPSRQKRDTEQYFSSIPIEERKQVKYVITDMYNPYLSLTRLYFPNAVCAIDSYHVVQWILHEINNILIKLLKNRKAMDQEYRDKRLAEGNPVRENWVSDAVYLLSKHRWVILRNRDNIDYTMPSHRDYHFGFQMDTYRYEDFFLRIDPDMEPIRDLKEKYIRFNNRNIGNPARAELELTELIQEYRECPYPIFHKFADLLEKYFREIINSFVVIETLNLDSSIDARRLSSGMIESFNRKPKDIRRQARGYRNFDHMRNRLLFATRKAPPLSGKSR